MEQHMNDQEQARQMCSHLMASKFVSTGVIYQNHFQNKIMMIMFEDDWLCNLSYIRSTIASEFQNDLNSARNRAIQLDKDFERFTNYAKLIDDAELKFKKANSD